MNIIIKGLIFFLFLCWWYSNKKNIKVLFMVIFFFIDFCRVAFLEKLLSNTFIVAINVIQLLIIVFVFILYIKSIINKHTDRT
ncbi:hypothetical protein [Clostridium sp. ATCC 25772]|uniref:hypothetical protein n=1 Tax=Clostridium sp. ATCC 25772 TaxID=1676991 RepID=UPI0007832814|nr:hypothetical protein [Clostridium sp. ATCC 25772]